MVITVVRTFIKKVRNIKNGSHHSSGSDVPLVFQQTEKKDNGVPPTELLIKKVLSDSEGTFQNRNCTSTSARTGITIVTGNRICRNHRSSPAIFNNFKKVN